MDNPFARKKRRRSKRRGPDSDDCCCLVTEVFDGPRSSRWSPTPARASVS